MTDKQLELAERELRAKGYGWIDGKYHKPPKKYAMLQKEFSCIRMINSLLAPRLWLSRNDERRRSYAV